VIYAYYGIHRHTDLVWEPAIFLPYSRPSYIDGCLLFVDRVLAQSFLLPQGLQTSKIEGSKRVDDHSVAVSDDRMQSSLSRLTVTLEIVSSTMDQREPTE